MIAHSGRFEDEDDLARSCHMVCLQFYTVSAVLWKKFYMLTNPLWASFTFTFTFAVFSQSNLHICLKVYQYLLVSTFWYWFTWTWVKNIICLKKTLLITLIQVLLKEVGLYSLCKVTHSLAVQTSRGSFFFLMIIYAFSNAPVIVRCLYAAKTPRLKFI